MHKTSIPGAETESGLITLKLTPDEARWLANALSIASCACVGKAETMRKWTAAMSAGLNAKIGAVPSKFEASMPDHV